MRGIGCFIASEYWYDWRRYLNFTSSNLERRYVQSCSICTEQVLMFCACNEEGLPWDSFALVSVPAPIGMYIAFFHTVLERFCAGGALVLSTNSLIYLNQSTRYKLPVIPCGSNPFFFFRNGVALNMFAGAEDSPIPLGTPPFHADNIPADPLNQSQFLQRCQSPWIPGDSRS